MADRERVLGFLRELEQADEEVGAVLAELDNLAREVETIRVRALELEAFFVRAPAQREAAESAIAHAGEELAAARAALVEAEAAVRTATEEGGKAAEHLAVRAGDRVSVAQRRSDEAVEAQAALVEAESAATREEAALEARARELARSLRKRPRLAADAGGEPGPGLAGLAEWGSAARAALFVARGQLAAERDAVVRQANELGALALGEPLTSAGAAVVARRVERELSD